jgi:coenzyme F420-0:L-glutamate ligase
MKASASRPVMIYPVQAPVQKEPFDLDSTLYASLETAGLEPQPGDVIAVSSKYAAISEGCIIRLDDVVISAEAQALAERYAMNPRIAQIVLDQADHVFGGIDGFLLTAKDGIISPNAGIDRSNIPAGYAVVFPERPYQTAERIRRAAQAHYGVPLGVILTDSWLMPGRWGTTGVALATAGFRPLQDERGKVDLFGNPLIVTVRGVADQLCAAAELVMGERDEATPFVLIRNAPIALSDEPLDVPDVSIDWRLCIYVESLTRGLLEVRPARADS